MTNIHPNARIGNNVSINPFTTIEADVEIGDNTWIGPNVTICDGARIGSDCKIFPGAVISAVPQDLKYKGEKTQTIIGNNTTIRECVTINRGTEALGRTEVGSNCLLMAYVHVAHDCVVGNNVILANSKQVVFYLPVLDSVELANVLAKGVQGVKLPRLKAVTPEVLEILKRSSWIETPALDLIHVMAPISGKP